MLYFGRVEVPDAFVALSAKGKKYAVVSALEFGRVKKASDFDVVLPLENYLKKAKEVWPQRRPGAAETIFLLSKELGVPSLVVPDDFPAGVYVKLFELGLNLETANGPLFPQRERKRPDEVEALRAGNRCSAAGIAAAERVLAASRIKGNKLLYKGEVLTSERLKFAIEVACLETGGVSSNTIAAGGDQACDPHGRGTGPLRPNELIIVDVFPRLNGSGYYGDMTRTFLRGRASDAQRKLVETVRAAQLVALKSIKSTVSGSSVHRKVVELFESRGFETKATPSGSVGFFHGTGHGVGLAIHEAPRISGSIDFTLRKDSVVTVEPGLYYPGLGGCRIEDVVQVTDGPPKLLSKFHYNWEIR